MRFAVRTEVLATVVVAGTVSDVEVAVVEGVSVLAGVGVARGYAGQRVLREQGAGGAAEREHGGLLEASPRGVDGLTHVELRAALLLVCVVAVAALLAGERCRTHQCCRGGHGQRHA